jgi:hypothetical protein
MTVQSYKMGPGTLALGTAGVKDVSAQVTSCTVNPTENVDETDPIPVLSGEEIAGEEDVSIDWTLSGTFVQDLAASGVVDYTWTNAGDWVDFHFTPSTSGDRAVNGQVRLVPLPVGGDVKSRPTADFEWKARGPAAASDPVLGDATP